MSQKITITKTSCGEYIRYQTASSDVLIPIKDIRLFRVVPHKIIDYKHNIAEYRLDCVCCKYIIQLFVSKKLTFLNKQMEILLSKMSATQ